MLVMTRRFGDEIVTDHPSGPVVIRVGVVMAGHVLLQVTAPDGVIVLRGEEWDAPIGRALRLAEGRPL